MTTDLTSAQILKITQQLAIEHGQMSDIMLTMDRLYAEAREREDSDPTRLSFPTFHQYLART